MIIYTTNLFKSWNDVGFIGNAPEPSEPIEGERFTSKEVSIYILDTYFSVKSALIGGAVSISGSSTTNTLIETSIFDNCQTRSSRAGAVAISDGQFVLNRCCGVACYVDDEDSFGQFAHITVTDNENSIHTIFESSIISCIPKYSDAGTLIYLMNGKINISNTNISSNKCNQISSFYFYPSQGTTSTIIYSSLYNNTATEEYCISFGCLNRNYEILYSNIIKNSINSDETVNYLIFVRSYATISHTSILENTIINLFDIVAGWGSVTILNCSIEEKYLKSSRMTTQKWNIGFTYMNWLTFPEFENCYLHDNNTTISTQPKENICCTSCNSIIVNTLIYLSIILCISET